MLQWFYSCQTSYTLAGNLHAAKRFVKYSTTILWIYYSISYTGGLFASVIVILDTHGYNVLFTQRLTRDW